MGQDIAAQRHQQEHGHAGEAIGGFAQVDAVVILDPVLLELGHRLQRLAGFRLLGGREVEFEVGSHFDTHLPPWGRLQL